MPPRRWSRSPTSSPRCASSSIPSTGASAASRGSSGDRDAGGWPMTARVVVAGTHSGVGKTTVATGLMGAFAERGRSVAGFKVGPDFIDPSYHALATGRPGRNLDAFLSGPDMVAPLFVHGAGRQAAPGARAAGGGLLRDGSVGRGRRARLRQLRPRGRRRGADPQPGRLGPARGAAAPGARPARRPRGRRAPPP